MAVSSEAAGGEQEEEAAGLGRGQRMAQLRGAQDEAGEGPAHGSPSSSKAQLPDPLQDSGPLGAGWVLRLSASLWGFLHWPVTLVATCLHTSFSEWWEPLLHSKGQRAKLAFD